MVFNYDSSVFQDVEEIVEEEEAVDIESVDDNAQKSTTSQLKAKYAKEVEGETGPKLRVCPPLDVITKT